MNRRRHTSGVYAPEGSELEAIVCQLAKSGVYTHDPVLGRASVFPVEFGFAGGDRLTVEFSIGWLVAFAVRQEPARSRVDGGDPLAVS